MSDKATAEAIKELIEKWEKEAHEMTLKENFFNDHGMKLDLMAQRELTNLLYKKITEIKELI